MRNNKIEISENINELRCSGIKISNVKNNIFEQEGNNNNIMNNISFYLNSNSIKTIEQNVFDRIINLYLIDLSSNKLKTILPKLFDKNINLYSINISHNEITYIQGTWSQLTHLRSINLSNNKLIHFRKAIFYLFLISKINNKYLNISNNFFVCDCDISWMIDLNVYTKYSNFENIVKCANKNMKLSDVMKNGFINITKEVYNTSAIYISCTNGYFIIKMLIII